MLLPLRRPKDKWPLFEAKMQAKGLGEAAIAAFKGNFDQLVQGVTGMVRWHAEPPPREGCLVEARRQPQAHVLVHMVA